MCRPKDAIQEWSQTNEDTLSAACLLASQMTSVTCCPVGGRWLGVGVAHSFRIRQMIARTDPRTQPGLLDEYLGKDKADEWREDRQRRERLESAKYRALNGTTPRPERGQIGRTFPGRVQR